MCETIFIHYPAVSIVTESELQNCNSVTVRQTALFFDTKHQLSLTQTPERQLHPGALGPFLPHFDIWSRSWKSGVKACEYSGAKTAQQPGQHQSNITLSLISKLGSC